MKLGFRARHILMTALMGVFAVVSFLPFYIMIMMSTQESNNLYRKVYLLPGSSWLSNIVTVFESNFARYYWNSLLVAVCATALSVLVSMGAGYAFAKFRFKGAGFLFTFVMVTMMIPSQVSLVGFLMEMRALGWIGTLLPLIVPQGADAFGVFWMRQYTISFVPTEVMESARIDGSGEFRTFFQIVFPMCRAAAITLGILAFSRAWNSYLVPLVVTNKADLYTVPIAISNLTSMYSNNFAVQIMALTLGTIPILIFFAMGSKYFIRGLSAGAVKG